MAKHSKMVKEWFTYASRDLRAAIALRGLGDEYISIVAFNCQQCVEKAIKGYLVYNKARPAKTHAIEDLALMVAAFDDELSKKLAKADKLTQYAVAYRYPDAELEPITPAKADTAIKLAQQVYNELFALVTK